MLDFLRRYQRYFFLVITVVIIISFSFFGTYSTLGSNAWREQVAFKAINGHDVTRSDVDEMALFLATDSEDKMLYGGAWGPNFLNDGVIRKDFLETGLAQELADAYGDEIKEDVNKRLAKEKKYTPYHHPQAPFLNVQNVWSYFAPQMKTHFDAMQRADNGLDAKAFDSRVQLYLAERQVPPSTLRYVLRHQEKQYGWIKPDDRLNQTDLSLFGYHTLEDWFGSHFTRLVSEFIINTAILAEKQGYEVTKAEVLTDLIRNTQTSYQQNVNNPNLGVTSAEEYLNEQLRRLNMDQARAVKIWRQVLLFRRYFHDAGANALVDTLANQNLHNFAQDSVTVDLYRLPAALKVANYDDLQKLETYLYAVTKQDKSNVLALPQQFLSVSDVSKKHPELVQKRYVLDVAQVNSKALQARIGLRELWNWEVEDQNWKQLIQKYPTLAVAPGKTREERFAALEQLDATTRAAVDNFAKQTIIQAHPEWIAQSLTNAQPKKMVVGLRIQGGKMPFSGVDDKEQRQNLIRLLDEAPIGENAAVDSPLYGFSADQQVYYRISVLGRSSAQEILTFAEARSDGTLGEVRDHILEQYYVANRGKDASLYQNESKAWKPFKDVRESVADQYFQKVVQSLEPIYKNAAQGNDPKTASKDQIAASRLYSFFNAIKTDLEKDASKVDRWVKVKADETEEDSDSLKESAALADQWKIEKVTVNLNRQNPVDEFLDVGQALALPSNAWSSLIAPVNGDLAFYQVKDGGEVAALDSKELAAQVRHIQKLLGAEAERHLMQQVLAELKNKNAISLAYLKIPMDEVPVEEQETVQPGF